MTPSSWGRSTPAMPRQTAEIGWSPERVSRISAKTFSTCSSPSVWRFAPVPAGLGHDRAGLVGQQADGLGPAGVDPDHVPHEAQSTDRP